MEPAASLFTLPCSIAQISDSSSMFCSNRSLKRNITRARTEGEVAAQPGYALAEEAMAALTSSTEARGNSVICSPVEAL